MIHRHGPIRSLKKCTNNIASSTKKELHTQNQMADIFISYSSKDKEKADQLSELLASAGLAVWIDQSGIVGAEKWATEIVEGIKACSTFILLLSPNSVESENVLRELSLASEKNKRVLPVDLEPTV